MFSVLTEPSFPKAAVGIEKDSITALRLEREGRGRFSVRQAATVEMPAGLLNPSFTERNIGSREEFAVVLSEAVESAGLLNQKRWSVSLPSTTSRSAILTVESGAASASEAEAILDWKAEQSFGAPAAELRITRLKISNDRQGRSRYFASAVKLSVIDEYETVFEGLGWKAGLILPRAVSETRWLAGTAGDSLLISSQEQGFTAVLLRGDEASVVRTVACADAELDDEIYRLLMFYNDRFAEPGAINSLDRVLVVGRELAPSKIREISSEALGRPLSILGPDDVGLTMPPGGLLFDDVAAPAALAALAWR